MSVGSGSSRAERIAGLAYDPAAEQLAPVLACNLCGSGHHVEVARRDRYGYRTRLVVCAACGLGFLTPRLTADAYGRFYADVYRPLVSAYHGRRIDSETVQEEQRDYADQLVAWASSVLPRPVASIMDIGGSTGIVAGAFSERFGAGATVLDPAPDELAVASRAGMETIAGFAEDFDAGDRRWDLVLLCQTIDHLLDIRGTLDAMRRMVADDGHVFVDVLDMGFMLRRRQSVEEVAKVDHPFYLTRSTGRAYLEQAGFALVAERMSDDGHWGFLARPDEPRALDLPAMKTHADALLDAIWVHRARSR